MLAAIAAGDCITLPKATRKDGSAVVTVDGLQISLHRHLYKLAIGPLAPSQKLLPNCITKGCANPLHRKMKTASGRSSRKTCPNGHSYKGNEMPAGSRARCRTCYEARKARVRVTDREYDGNCLKGHKLTESNVYVNTDRKGLVHRRCKKCHLARTRAYRANRKGSPA